MLRIINYCWNNSLNLQKQIRMELIPILKEIHSFVAAIFLLTAIIFVVFCILRIFGKARFSSTQFVLAKMAFIMSHIQLLLGLVMFVLYGYPQLLSDNAKMVMSDSALRRVVIEHPFTNIIAIILISIGFISLKKMTDDHARHIKGAIYYGIALILILAMIPYNQWLH